MSSINTNVPSIIAARILGYQNEAVNTSLERLSTGLRINRGKDDPAGLIASESLRAEQKAIIAAMDNARRADQLVSVAESGLGEVSTLLLELEDLVDRTANEAGLSDDEVAANQLQIDSILDTINRIANSTSFNGKKMLDGSLDYTLSGVQASSITNVQVTGARLPDGGNRTVVVEVTQSAQTAQLRYIGDGLSAGNSVTIQVAGNYGTELFSFAASSHVSAMAAAINQATEMTGVSAVTNAANSAVTFGSTEYGSNAFVTVSVISSGTDEFTLYEVDSMTTTSTDQGQDAGVTINGTSATTDGLNASVRSAALSLEMTLNADFGQQLTNKTFYVTGGGADFSLSPEVGLAGKVGIGIFSVATGSLGDANVGYLSSLGSGQANDVTAGNFATGQRMVRAAVQQVSNLRGRLGAFQSNTIQSTIRALQVTYENTTAAESAIRDTDFATETAALTRAQILVQSATAALQLANAAPQNILALIR
ncbi:MAG TPA: flagellin [Phycisphaerae bacterium]|nr:flagellin [Phycisphaerae bacterium]